jgi:hypothetical protein
VSAPRCASCSGGADPDRVLAVAGRCACGVFGALYLPPVTEAGGDWEVWWLCDYPGCMEVR